MKLDQLQYFVVVAETQHIGRASGILNISPSAISHSIRNLEESLGHSLFEKSGKNIYLTEYGKKLSVRARQVLDEVEKVKVEFRSPTLPLTGLVRVGATHGIGARLIAPALSRLQEKHPELVYEFYSLRSSQVLDMTANGSLDIGICFSPQAHPTVTIQHEIKVPMKIAVRKGHPLLKGKQVMAALSKLPSASPKAFAGIEICENHPSLVKAGINQNVKFIFDSYEVAAEYLKSSEAWCLMPATCIEMLGLSALKAEDIKAEAVIGILSPKGRSVDPRILGQLTRLNYIAAK
jgi:DNA-binding transcriptional LysR family regulator